MSDSVTVSSGISGIASGYYTPVRLNPRIRVMLDDFALAPVRAHDRDGGLDLRCPMFDTTIAPGDSLDIDTGVHVEIPEGYAGLLVSKSGLNVNHDIVSTGLIDSGYTGSIHVKLHNLGHEEYTIEFGDKISQLVLVPVMLPEMVLVNDLDDTERGSNGFGSSGR